MAWANRGSTRFAEFAGVNYSGLATPPAINQIFASPTIMDPARRTPLTAHEPKSRALKTSISKKSGNQSGECHNAGELSRLPDLPLDVLYEVRHGIISVTDNGVDRDDSLAFTDILPRLPDGSVAHVVG